ncbi:hypothetical protein MO973_19970 [Paenibacillus sp. TRM 82003]|nr:hypothetical protein [Paenibacillus sp. TRM 82003]
MKKTDKQFAMELVQLMEEGKILFSEDGFNQFMEMVKAEDVQAELMQKERTA